MPPVERIPGSCVAKCLPSHPVEPARCNQAFHFFHAAYRARLWRVRPKIKCHHERSARPHQGGKPRHRVRLLLFRQVLQHARGNHRVERPGHLRRLRELQQVYGGCAQCPPIPGRCAPCGLAQPFVNIQARYLAASRRKKIHRQCRRSPEIQNPQPPLPAGKQARGARRVLPQFVPPHIHSAAEHAVHGKWRAAEPETNSKSAHRPCPPRHLRQFEIARIIRAAREWRRGHDRNSFTVSCLAAQPRAARRVRLW